MGTNSLFYSTNGTGATNFLGIAISPGLQPSAAISATDTPAMPPWGLVIFALLLVYLGMRYLRPDPARIEG